MKKKVMAAVLLMSMMMGSSLTVCAAPEIMADGAVFDAAYYAQMYPDVAAVLGTDADALYQHYVNFGKAEGRSPYDAVSVQQTGNSKYMGSLTTELPTFPDEVRILNNARVPVVLDSLDGHYLEYTGVTRRKEFGINGDRKDYSSDPVYLAARDYIISSVDEAIASGQKQVDVHIPIRFITSDLEECYYFVNLVDNLAIDLNKSGIGEKVRFYMGVTSADGKGYQSAFGHEDCIFCLFNTYFTGRELFEEQKDE